MPFAGAIFDWDGVVVNSSKIHEESWEILARKTTSHCPLNTLPSVLEKETK